jgi:hypothetical protein
MLTFKYDIYSATFISWLAPTIYGMITFWDEYVLFGLESQQK